MRGGKGGWLMRLAFCLTALFRVFLHNLNDGQAHVLRSVRDALTRVVRASSSCSYILNEGLPGVTACHPIPWLGGDNRIPEDQHLLGGAAWPSGFAASQDTSFLNRFAEVASMP